VCSNRLGRVVAAAFLSNDSVEVIDAEGPSLLRASLSGSCSKRPLKWEGMISSGVFSGRRWLVLSEGRPNATQLVRLEDRPRALFDLPHRPRTPLDREASFVTASSGRTMHASMIWPFEWVALDTAGTVVLESRAITRTTRALVDTTYVDWVGLPVFQLDSGFLQTLADPRSDKRVLVLYDLDGRVVNRRAMNVAFGILTVSVHQRMLLALRRSDRNELVRYRWDWRQHFSDEE
jgi:hypothetical protein